MMKTKIEILDMISAYKAQFPNEIRKIESFVNFVSKSNDNDLYLRSNFIGHITASAIIISKTTNKILMLFHKQLSRFLQPGGHVDEDDLSIIDAVYREVLEETRIIKNNLINLSSFYNDYPTDIDSHYIPENNKKNETKHRHHDLCYIFLYTGKDEDVMINIDESDSSKWISLSDLYQDQRLKNLQPKIRKLLACGFRIKLFYDAIAKYVKEHINTMDYKIIVVAHLVPDCHYYLKAINSIFPILAVIPKPKSIKIEIRRKIENDFTVIDVSRVDMLNTNENNPIYKLIKENQNVIIFDIGGYFSEVCSTWDKEVYGHINLIVEDTENGAQKYEKARRDIPIVSVARSPLKENEDFLVGQSILFSAESILRQNNNNLISYMKCGVLGYGKIGKSISTHLLQRNIKASVFDTNPIKRIEAFNNLCLIPDRNTIINVSSTNCN